MLTNHVLDYKFSHNASRVMLRSIGQSREESLPTQHCCENQSVHVAMIGALQRRVASGK